MDIEEQIDNTYDALREPFNLTDSLNIHRIKSNIIDNLTTLVEMYESFPTIDYTE